jgi:ATP-dependent DNA helicase RecQ
VLTKRQPVTLTRPVTAPEPAANRAGQISCDEVLFERLRVVRKRLADELNVPAYIVFSDVALRQMARDYPTGEREFARISGVGEKKLREFGAPFLSEIAAHLSTSPRQIFADDSFVEPRAARRHLNDTMRETLQAFRVGRGVAEIARRRGLTTGTILGHLAAAIEAGERLEWERLVPPEQQRQIAAAFAQIGEGSLGAVKERLGNHVDYGQLRIYRAAKYAGLTH